MHLERDDAALPGAGIMVVIWHIRLPLTYSVISGPRQTIRY